MDKPNLLSRVKSPLSLQSQYILFTTLLGIMTTVAIFFSYNDMSKNYQTLVEHTKLTAETRNQTLKMRAHIDTLVKGINAVMLQPEFKDQIDLIFRASFNELNQIVLQLSDDRIVSNIDLTGELEKFSFNLIEFHEVSDMLFEIRSNVNQQYPSMEISNNIIRPARNRIFNILNTGLRELDEDDFDQEDFSYRESLLKTKGIMRNALAEYRLYLANRIASFDEDQLFEQENNLEGFIQQIQKNASDMQNYSEFFGFESAELIPQLPEIIEQWKQGYLTVKDISHSDAWRKDTELMRLKVLPLIETIIKSLVNIDHSIELKNADLLQEFGEIGKWQTMLLVVIVIVFIIYSLLSLAFLRVLMFKPLSILADALRFDDLKMTSSKITKLCRATEIKTLLDSFLTMHSQVTKRQEELTHQALHDALTSLPNRKFLMERLHHHIHLADRNKDKLSFLMLDLNGFKQVNDTLGHHVGDQLLIKVGERLKNLLREIDTIARLGGDEFSIVLPYAGRNEAAIIAEKINQTLALEFTLDDCVLHVGTSIGIAEYPEDGNNIHDLMKHADIAMYSSKKAKSEYCFYDAEDNDHSIQRLSLSNDLLEAIKNQSIELHYQSKFELKSNELVGVEALLRWNHPSYGYIPPEQVIEIAENSAFIDELSLCIFEKAINDWLLLENDYPDIKLAVNLSVHNLKEDAFFIQIKHLINQYKVNANNIIFEVTESATMADPKKSIELLKKLTALGVKISLDDFGTGFSSLSYLKKLPISELKIDRSFIKNIADDSDDLTIVKSTIDLAHNLGLSVVAEGVENKEALETLKAMNCDMSQGYFLSKPLNFVNLINWLNSR